MSEVNWAQLHKLFPNPVQLLNEDKTEVPRGVFLEVLEALHGLIDKELDSYTLAFYALVDAARDSNYRMPRQAAALITECGICMELDNRSRVRFSRHVRVTILAATCDGAGQTKELRDVREFAEVNE